MGELDGQSLFCTVVGSYVSFFWYTEDRMKLLTDWGTVSTILC